MRIEAKGLSAGWHGVHLHDKGDCSKSDFTSAGPHVHGSAAAVHGLLNPAANDLGDLPNIHAGADGAAAAEVFSSLVTLKALRDADGSAVVIHANPDDYMAQPIGGAGPAVACGDQIERRYGSGLRGDDSRSAVRSGIHAADFLVGADHLVTDRHDGLQAGFWPRWR